MIGREFHERLLESSFPDILGQEEAKGQLKSALLMGRNVIIVGPPGIGKTTLARNVARLLPKVLVNDCGYNCLPGKAVCPECLAGKTTKTKVISGEQRFVRVQGSPDLTSEDLLGDIDPVKAIRFGPASIEAFTPGKIFKANNGVLFFDELNRCPEKVQNALLQALEEKKATIGSYTVDLEADFIFLGTMNPQDTSTEKLSEVLSDRFDLVYMAYPEAQETEEQIALKKGKKAADFPPQLFSRMVAFVRALRNNKKLSRLPSVRATIGLYERAQANALLRAGDTVTAEDIRDAAVSVLAHRIEVKPSAKYMTTPQDVLREELDDFLQKGDYR
ncbi:ATP-binding protein [Candidatus Woesearchaeota archaeon]|nr:ATP-binding protein [Candidatus Woesearchaeota archaeon]